MDSSCNTCEIIAHPDVAATLRYLETTRKPRRAAAYRENRELIEMLCHRIQIFTYVVHDHKWWEEDDLKSVVDWLKKGKSALDELIELLDA